MEPDTPATTLFENSDRLQRGFSTLENEKKEVIDNMSDLFQEWLQEDVQEAKVVESNKDRDRTESACNSDDKKSVKESEGVVDTKATVPSPILNSDRPTSSSSPSSKLRTSNQSCSGEGGKKTSPKGAVPSTSQQSTVANRSDHHISLTPLSSPSHAAKYMLLNAVKEGFMTKQGGKVKTWKKRWFVLTKRSLYYFCSPEDTKPTGIIHLNNAKLHQDEPRWPNCMVVCQGDRNYRICADTKKTLEAWVGYIKLAINYATTSPSSPQSLRADSMGERNTPSLRPEDEDILKEGYLTKKGKNVRNWKRRFFVLKSGGLHYYKNPKAVRPVGTIQLHGSVVREGTAGDDADSSDSSSHNHSHKNGFVIETDQRTWYLQATDPILMNEWIQSIQTSIMKGKITV